MKRLAATLVILFVLACPAATAAKDGEGKDIALGECLVLKPVGRYGRAALHLDALEAEIVAGKWLPAKAGDKLKLPGGGEQTWEAATAKDGALDHAALAGGYVYWKIDVDEECVRILEASGHLMVYVNGEPRVGDPYQNGIVRLPVRLLKGPNTFLFHCGRGHLQARLKHEGGAAIFDMPDATVPDYRVGEDIRPWAAVVVINPGDQPLKRYLISAELDKGDSIATTLPDVPPLCTRKVGFRIPAAPADAGETVGVHLRLLAKPDGPPLDDAKLTLRVRKPDQSYKRTFVSDIDGSVQYYAVQPARPKTRDDAPPALFLTLHGAGVEAIGQADAYGGKSWGHIVAPTNRRPYGFDWEDWGRLDAIEVLELAQKELKTDPLRTYLTGHSMGGHGVWQVGATHPDRFAAIAASAGWISFWTYAGGKRPEKPTEMEAMLLRAVAPSDTLTLAHNYAQYGVYVLHGEADDNVPVGQAREMRKVLGGFHPDFVYYERPGAGHWWGNECVDWPPLFEFLQRHKLTPVENVRQVNFVTASPGVSARSQWAEIQAQVHKLRPSSVNLRVDPDKRRFSGTTENVARLALDIVALKPDKPLDVELDGQKIENIDWPGKTSCLWLKRDAGKSWNVSREPSPGWTGPHRAGPFKDAFRNHMVFVYGTVGNKEENEWAFAKARYDAETFWYRGNGAVDLVADADFDADKDCDRNVILYGHADSNTAWKALLSDSPVQVKRGRVQVGERNEIGANLACLFLRPRPGSDRALIGVVTGTGINGLRLTDRMPYFVSGCGYPDCIILGQEVLERGAEGVRAAGFFGMDWRVTSGEFVWATEK
jgi:pimeloyl-ACP methyl ester carboxylesterase